jgi:hypothetical protein
MNAETFIQLIEEMIDLKIQQQAEANLTPTPEVAKLLQEKQTTDRRRMNQIKAELVRMLDG